VQGLGSGPFCQGLLANLEEHSAAALVLGAHDMHTALVACAGAAAARDGLYDLNLFTVVA
jgi:hypothetical protein